MERPTCSTNPQAVTAPPADRDPHRERGAARLAKISLARRFRADRAAPDSEIPLRLYLRRRRDRRRACATTAKPSTNTVLCRACSTTSPAATRPPRCSARPMPRRSAFRRWALRRSCAYRGDIVLTQAAAAENVPMILSASSLITLEDVRAANQAAWYQAYLAGLPERIEPLVDRVAAAGYDTFVVTADVPVPPNRENNIRNGFQVPLAITPRVFWDTVTHPHWLFGTWARTVKNFGMPHFENMDAKRGPPVLAKNLMRNIGHRDQLAWKHVELIRKTLEGQARRQGTGLAGGCAHRARERRRRRDALQPWRPPARLHHVGPAHAAGDRGRSQGHDDHGRRRHPPRHRRDQGARRSARISSGSAVPSSMPRSPAARPACSARSRCCKAEIDRDLALLGIRSISEITPDLVRKF